MELARTICRHLLLAVLRLPAGTEENLTGFGGGAGIRIEGGFALDGGGNLVLSQSAPLSRPLAA